jgi:hypothetical protein
MADPKNPGDRTKAHRFRRAIKAGQKLQPVDELWLSEYEEKDSRRQHANGSPDVGASRSGRKINFQMEEQAEAVGTGTAAAAAASAALAAKEEGRRLDSLTINSVDALKEACAVYKDICLTLRDRTEILEQTHVEMLLSVRAHFLAATQAESALVQKDAEGDPAKDLLTMLLAKHLGIPIEGLKAAASLPATRRPPPNGAKKP